jgi:hypothetical protein
VRNQALRSIKLDVSVELVTEVCINCGGVFALPGDLVVELQRCHAQFYCPVGHPQYYPAKTTEELLRAELEQERARANRLRGELDQECARADELVKAKSKLERQARATARRATNGACSLCHRSFANVQRHMSSKHPDQVVHA